MSAANTIHGAVCLMKIMRSAFTSGSCGRWTHVDPQLDQQEHRFIIPHCTTMTMAMVLSAHTTSFQNTAQKSCRPLHSFSQAAPTRKPNSHIMNLRHGLALPLHTSSMPAYTMLSGIWRQEKPRGETRYDKIADTRKLQPTKKVAMVK